MATTISSPTWARRMARCSMGCSYPLVSHSGYVQVIGSKSVRSRSSFDGVSVMIPKALILRAPGINRDGDAAAAIELAGGRAERVHVNRVVEGAVRIDDYALLIIPGGF